MFASKRRSFLAALLVTAQETDE